MDGAETSRLGDDLLTGADAIAEELGFSRRRIYHLVERNSGIPIHRVKGLGLCARKSSLRAWFERLDDDASRQGELPLGQD